MAFVTVFKRYELKYLLTLEQKEKILAAMSPYMELDKYGRTTIRNIYFDTDNYRLIRRSIEKPTYKEKLRIRSYSQATFDSTVFVELKKKYESVVYKRRIALCEADAMAWVCREKACPLDTQISREVDYFIDFYGKLKPAVFLTYEREAYYDKGGGDFRVTFDDNILCRRTDVSLCSPVYGEKILPEGKVLMELKKKYEQVVYKRRLSLCESDAIAWVCREKVCPIDTQISREIDYFIDFYEKLKPSVFLSYDREAYYDKGGGDFRVTFDDNILYRQIDINLCSPVYGEPILPEDRVLMELKCSGGIPLWMTRALSQERIYKTSFSKYGTAYSTLIFPKIYMPN